MIDEKMFEQLTALSKFDFTDEGKERFIKDLNAIIGFIGKVKEFDGEYDDKAVHNEVPFSDLREDVAFVTATPEQLLLNTQSANNCYVIPKVIE